MRARHLCKGVFWVLEVLDGDDFSILFHQPMDFGSKMDAQDFQECDLTERGM